MQMVRTSENRVSTAEVAKRAGVHRDTLLRWLRHGLVKEPVRDRHGWRLFSENDVAEILAFANLSEPVRTESGESQDLEYLNSLQEMDWDFAGAKTNYLTHRLHPYPAKFIPQIPNAIIQELSSVGDTVLDIFCGSGTTLVEALTLKRNAIGIDANPLACLIASAKTTPIAETDHQVLAELSARTRELADRIFSDQTGPTLFGASRFQSSAWRPDFPRLPFWFEDHVIEELAEILRWCRELPTPASRNLALVSLSAIIVAVSRQDSDTRYVRREKNIGQGETLKRFSRSLDLAISSALEFTDLYEPRFSREIVTANLLDSPNLPAVNLVVCSPPYPNAYSYHLYHMTRMIWLGFDQPKFKREEIGSHRKYSAPGRSAATVDTFKMEFAQIFSWLSRTVRMGGHACFVVGDSTLRGVRYNNATILSDIAQAFGMREVARIGREMQATKKAFNPAIGRIKEEKILILKNMGRGTDG